MCKGIDNKEKIRREMSWDCNKPDSKENSVKDIVPLDSLEALQRTDQEHLSPVFPL